ncbi:MAG: phosphoribosyltransferase family protein [bacterium]
MDISKSEIERLLLNLGVLKKGHFILTSKRHSSFYFEKFRILEQPHYASLFAQIMVSKLKTNLKVMPDLICGPATGGMILAFEVARILQLPCIYLEKKDGLFALLRGMNINPGQKVVIVDDVLTTGKSLYLAKQVINEKQGIIQGQVVLIDRRTKADQDVFSVYKAAGEDYSEDKCPMCKQKIPLTDPKTGKIIKRS